MSVKLKVGGLCALTVFWGAGLGGGAESPPQFSWARRVGGAAEDRSAAIALDPAGSVLVTGFFTGSATIGNSNFLSSGLEDVFVAKYDGAGSFLWGRQAGGTGDDFGLGVATDASGNVYVTGSFQNTATFSPTNSLTATGSGGTRPSDVFIAKYNSAGNLIWVRGAGGGGSDQANAIAVDAQGNAYITGSFDASATFGPNSLANSSGADDIFVAKCSNVGDFLWARKAGDSGTNNTGKGIALDGVANLYVTGHFGATATFGASSLTSGGPNSLPDVFLAKYNIAGNLLWVRQGGGTGDDRGNGVAADSAGNISITGQFVGTATFGTANLVANGSGTDVFVARYDAAGNLLWARRAGGSNAIYGDAGFGIATDADSNAVVAGYFSGTASFGNSNLISAGFQNPFCCKYDPAGSLLWARAAGGSRNDFGCGAVSDGFGRIFLAGFFSSGTVAFDSVILTNSGGMDCFLTKLGVTIVPSLSVSYSNAQVVLYWSAVASDYALESATNLATPAWTPIPVGTNIIGTNRVLTLPSSEPRKFFRLHKQ